MKTGKTERRERTLYAPVAAFLQQRGYKTKTDTKYGDVIGYNAHRDLLAAVEVKRDDARSALGQAIEDGNGWRIVPVVCRESTPADTKTSIEMLEYFNSISGVSASPVEEAGSHPTFSRW